MIDNIVLFSAESLRYDFCPDLEGLKFKCIASSTHTGTSLSTMITGLNPRRHLAYDFRNSIPEPIKTIFDLPGYNTYFITHEGSAIPYVIRQKKSVKTIEEVEEPFIVVDEGVVSHFPYRWEYRDRDDDFLKEVIAGKRNIIKEYQYGINNLIIRYKNLISSLKERNLLENTLIIFCGDHGELLGEHGFFGHCKPVSPELVYVPLILYNPKFKSRNMNMLARQVDILPTVLKSLGIEENEMLEGIDLLNPDNETAELVGYNEVKLYQKVGGYKASSVWTASGGYIEEEGMLTRDSRRVMPYNQKYRWVKGTRVEGKIIRGEVEEIYNAKRQLELFKKDKWKGVIRWF